MLCYDESQRYKTFVHPGSIVFDRVMDVMGERGVRGRQGGAARKVYVKGDVQEGYVVFGEEIEVVEAKF